MPSRETGATPAQSKDSARPEPSKTQPIVFEWYENRVEQGLATLYRVDVAQRQHIVEMIRELEDSNMLWGLLSKWGDATQEAKDDGAKHEALMALLARIYIAGSLRGCQAVDL